MYQNDRSARNGSVGLALAVTINLETSIMCLSAHPKPPSPEMMSLRFFLLLLFQLSISGILAINNEDPTGKTMEDFSGYPIHAPIDYSFAAPNTLLSFLSVDSTALENQVPTNSKYFFFNFFCRPISLCFDFLLLGV